MRWEFHRFVDLFEFIPCTVFCFIGTEMQYSSMENLLQRLQGELLLEGTGLHEIYSLGNGVQTLPIFCVLEGEPWDGRRDCLV